MTPASGPRRTTPGPADVVRRLPVGELGWDDLVVPPDVAAALRSLAADAAAGGLVVGTVGPCGVGKTFAARVWAESMRLDLWRVDCPLLVARHGAAAASRGVGEAVAHGERPHAVLLFHAADALPADAVAAVVARAAIRRAPTVLEARSAVAVGTALPGVARVDFPFPDAVLRRRHWERAVTRASPLSRPDLDALAALEVPGAVIDAAVRAVVLSNGDERVETDDLVEAVREHVR
jgi:hypothetical protein